MKKQGYEHPSLAWRKWEHDAEDGFRFPTLDCFGKSANVTVRNPSLILLENISQIPLENSPVIPI